MPGQLKPLESRFIRLGARFVEYRLARRHRRTLGISVDAGGLAVAAPHRAPLRAIEAFLLEKERWILAKLDEWSRAPCPREISMESGESLPVEGVERILEVRECGARDVSMEAERLVVRAPGPRRAAQALGAWLRLQALERMAPRAAHFAAQLGLPAPRVALSNARAQWGVCRADGTIRLNWRLVHLEPALADYVVAHEVGHLVEMNHSRRFWDVVAKLYPAWREARGALELAAGRIPVIKEA